MGRLNSESSGGARVRRRAGDRHRAGVGTVGQECTQGHSQGDPQFGRQDENLLAELAPAHVGLNAVDEDNVASGQWQSSHVQARGWPGEAANTLFVEGDHGAIDLVVVVVLRVHLGERSGTPGLPEVIDRVTCRVARVVPSLKRGDKDGVDEIGKCLELDHAATSAPISRTATSPYALAPMTRLRSSLAAWHTPSALRCPPGSRRSFLTWTAP